MWIVNTAKSGCLHSSMAVILFIFGRLSVSWAGWAQRGKFSWQWLATVSA